MWPLLFVIVCLFLLLLMRVMELNRRVDAVENVLDDCVTKDRLRALVAAHIKGCLEEE